MCRYRTPIANLVHRRPWRRTTSSYSTSIARFYSLGRHCWCRHGDYGNRGRQRWWEPPQPTFGRAQTRSGGRANCRWLWAPDSNLRPQRERVRAPLAAPNTRRTVLTPTPRSRAIASCPLPVARRSLMASSTLGSTLGRPRRLPFARALSRPAHTRSRIIARSNSANTPIIWNSAFPPGVVVSTPRRSRSRSTPCAWTSPRNATRS